MVLVVNMIPKSLSGESNQDSEPNLAVNPANPREIAASAFTPDPMGGPNAPIYVSTDGGKTWLLHSIVPSSPGSPIGTFDITLRCSGKGKDLYAGIIRDPTFDLNVLRTRNFLNSTVMTVLVDRPNVDQPFVQATAVRGKDHVYVGNNDFNALNGQTATIDRSLNAASTPPAGFSSIRIETRNTSGQDGPSIRPAIHRDGTIYASFFGWRAFNGSEATADVVVVRDDHWGKEPTPFSALKDPLDHKAGVRVIQNTTIPWFFPLLGQERIGSDLTITVNPRKGHSSKVYIAWADRPLGTPDYTLHVRSSIDRGLTWSNDLRTISNGKNPSLAINSNGKVGFLYQQLIFTGSGPRWVTHLELTADHFATTKDIVLANVPADTPPPAFYPYLGDYIHLMAVNKDFYGIFSANNTPDKVNFPQGVIYHRKANFATHTLLALDGITPVPVSIDPFFFKVKG